VGTTVRAVKFIRTWLGLFLLALSAGVANGFAQEITSVLVPPANPVAAGAPATVWVYRMNNSTNEVQSNFAPHLNGLLFGPNGSSNLVMNLADLTATQTVTIAPGAFARRQYLVPVPVGFRGSISLSVSNYNEIALWVTDGPLTQTVAVTPPPFPVEPVKSSTGAMLAKFFNNHITPYEPIYFLLGNYPAAEFQISLKYQLFDLTNHFSILTNLYFGYTQTSYWDLISRDPSFFDTSYKPSVFVYFPAIFRRDDQKIQLDLQGGAEHESNGRGGVMERSIYSAYLQPRITFGRPGHLQFALQPRASAYFLVAHNNSDIAEYRGYVDLHAFLTLKRDPNSWANFQIETRFRIGDGGSHPGVQVDARYKIPHFNPMIDVQVFEGYGQTLRQYNQEAHGLRVGLCLWNWPDYPVKASAN